MRVILDTNVIVADRWFKGGAFRLLLECFELADDVIVLPQVVVDEAVNNLREAVTSKTSDAQAAAKGLAYLTNEEIVQIPEIDLDKVLASYRQFLHSEVESRGGEVLPYPSVTHDSLVSRDLLRKKPFSAKGTGYRDALIWHAVLDVLKETDDDVVLVTSNKADFASVEEGLHEDLAGDLEEAGIEAPRLRLFLSLQSFVDQIVKPDLQTLRAAPVVAEEVAATRGSGLVDAERRDSAGAEEYYRFGLETAEQIGDRLDQANQLGNLGNVYRRRGDLDGAEEHYRKSLEIAEEIGDRSLQAKAIGNLGNVYADRGEPEDAEEHYRKALGIAEETDDRRAQAMWLGNLGNMHADRGALKRAEENYRKALEIVAAVGNRLGQANQLGNLGRVHERLGDLEGAEEYHRKALDLDEEIDNRSGQAQDLANLGVVQARRGDLDAAEELYKSALVVAEEIGARHLIGQIRDLRKALKETHD